MVELHNPPPPRVVSGALKTTSTPGETALLFVDQRQDPLTASIGPHNIFQESIVINNETIIHNLHHPSTMHSSNSQL